MDRIKFSMQGGEFDPDDYQGKRSSFYAFSTYSEKWLKKYTNLYNLNRIAPQTIKKIEGYAKNHYIPYFQNRDIREIKNGDVEDFYLALPKNLRQGTYRSIMNYLHKFFVDALNRDDIKKMPRFPSVPGEPTKITVLGDDLIAKIIDCINEKHQGIFKYIWRQGVRPGEARALQIENVDMVNKTVTIKETFSGEIYHEKTKNKKIREVPLYPDPDFYKLLFDQIGSRTGGFVFLNPRKLPYCMRTLSFVWSNALKKCGVPHVRLYTLRHSFATNALNAGAPKDLILKFIGTTVQSYLHDSMTGHNKVLNCICPPSDDSKK